MSNETPSYRRFSYDEHARTCAPDDFLGQTMRTVHGVPVSEEQIQMIVMAIKSGLALKPDDMLLELACGNGFLSQFLFNSCSNYLGTDISEYLISVAKKNFEILPNYQFSVKGAIDYIHLESHPEKFTKALCYAGFQYFPDRDASNILKNLFIKFSNVQTIFLGNLPDKDRAEKFYMNRRPSSEELSDSCTAIGIWRTKTEFEQLAVGAGWKVNFSIMPAEFNGAYYRYDALLRR